MALGRWEAIAAAATAFRVTPDKKPSQVKWDFKCAAFGSVIADHHCSLCTAHAATFDQERMPVFLETEFTSTLIHDACEKLTRIRLKT